MAIVLAAEKGSVRALAHGKRRLPVLENANGRVALADHVNLHNSPNLDILTCTSARPRAQLLTLSHLG